MSWIQCPWLGRERKRLLNLSLKYESVCFCDEWGLEGRTESWKEPEMLQTQYRACIGSGFISLAQKTVQHRHVSFLTAAQVEHHLPSAGSRPVVISVVASRSCLRVDWTEWEGSAWSSSVPASSSLPWKNPTFYCARGPAQIQVCLKKNYHKEIMHRDLDCFTLPWVRGISACAGWLHTGVVFTAVEFMQIRPKGLL